VSQQHRHEYAAGFPHGLPVRLSYTSRKFPPPSGGGARCARPRSARFEPVAQVKDVKRRFLAYSFPPRSPDPHHLAVLARPGFVRAAPTLPATTRIRLPSATATCCDRPQAKVSHLHTNQQRLTAQTKLGPDPDFGPHLLVTSDPTLDPAKLMFASSDRTPGPLASAGRLRLLGVVRSPG
jgi:hypothetical protein